MTMLKDGVYLGLSETAYFAQGRLGSSDLVKLFKTPADWWWSSSFNPNRKDRKWTFGNDRDYGHGFHYLLLEGERVYAERCAICPFDGFTTKEAKAWRDEVHLEGRVILSEEMDRNIRHMVALVANHPQLAEPMAAGLSEVSVLYTDDDGHRMRARFDKLLPGYVLDPKSFGAHKRGRDDQDRALRIIAELSYDVQRYQYDMARERMIKFILDGQVFGGTEDERAWLQRFPEADEARLADRMLTYPDGHPDQQSAWSWAWLFLQKPSDSKGHAPVVMPIERPRFDLTWRTGKQKVERALANFDHYKARFGLGDDPNEDGEVAIPWASINPLWRPLDEHFPSWLSDISMGLNGADEQESETDQ